MKNLAKYIDHTYLKAEARAKDIDKLISEASQYGFKSICINSSWVKYASSKIKNSDLLITSVIGFPLGAAASQAKIHEAKLAINHGADEIDMVMNIGRFKDGQHEYVLNEIKDVKKAIGNKVLKVIVETALLNKKEIQKVSELVLHSGADFIKTSTGFSFRGASFDDIKIMKSVIKNKIGIKAAGGIKSLEDMKKMIELGATRIGTSSAVKILNQGNPKNIDY